MSSQDPAVDLVSELLTRADAFVRGTTSGDHGPYERVAEAEELIEALQVSVESLQAENHKLTGKLIHAEDVLGVIAQDGTDYPQRTAEQYFEEVNRA